MAFDGHAVAVVNPDQVRQLQMPRERGRFVRDAFHHVAVAANRVHAVVEQRRVRAIEVALVPARGHRHADAIAEPLPKRSRGGLDAGRHPVLGVARRIAVDLAEMLDVVERHGRRAGRLAVFVDGFHVGQMQQRIQQHRRMPGRQHEAVAIRPQRLVRVVTQVVLPQVIGDRRERHRRAGVAGIGFLHGVHRQRADRVDAQLIEGGIVLHGTLLVRQFGRRPTRAAERADGSAHRVDMESRASGHVDKDAKPHVEPPTCQRQRRKRAGKSRQSPQMMRLTARLCTPRRGRSVASRTTKFRPTAAKTR